MSVASGIPFGHFVLQKRLARGGMAEVFLARQSGPEGFDRRVAVKRILPHLVETDQFVRMFHDEARIAARLTHPNIVHIYEFGRVGDHYFIAMEYVQGVHAGQLIKKGARERLPPALAARIIADACAGLHYAHRLTDAEGRPLGIVHRDISPPNLMISFDGVVKLVDFGIAKAVSQVEQTRPGVVKGKYAYMSPEQTTNKKLDGRSDVFSLALVLWELLAGRVALTRDDPVEAMRAIRDGKIPSIESARPDVPAALAAALDTALQVNREDRPSASELGLMLEGFIKASPELGTSLQLAEWIRPRFPRMKITGEVAALRAPAATRATVAATRATGIAATSATIATTSSPPGDDEDTEQVDLTEVVRDPTFIESGAHTGAPGYAPILTGSHRRISTRRIAIVAVAAVAAGVVGMILLLGGGSDADQGRAAAPARAPLDAAPAPLAATGPDAAPVAEAPRVDAAPARASIEIYTEPAEASDSIGDDKPIMTSPARFEGLEPGERTLTIELDGYEMLERTVRLEPGERLKLDYSLRAIPPPEPPPTKKKPVTTRRPKRGKGKLTVRTNPYSVVYLGKRKLGTTPFANVTLAAGTYTLTFKNPGRKPYRRRVTIRAGKPTKLNFRLP